jgi:hypothetical protein
MILIDSSYPWPVAKDNDQQMQLVFSIMLCKTIEYVNMSVVEWKSYAYV